MDYTQYMSYTTIFIDLDDTVYPASSGLWDAIRERIDLYMIDRVHIAPDIVTPLRKNLFSTYGTTMRGLVAEYQIDEQDYLDFVHNVPLADFISPNPLVRQALDLYSQRKVIFTNADTNHANRVLNILQLADCFDQIIDIRAIAPYCKPQPDAFRIALDHSGAKDPAKCVLVDDALFNVTAARELGFYTVQVGPKTSATEPHASIKSLAELPLVLDPNGQ